MFFEKIINKLNQKTNLFFCIFWSWMVRLCRWMGRLPIPIVFFVQKLKNCLFYNMEKKTFLTSLGDRVVLLFIMFLGVFFIFIWHLSFVQECSNALLLFYVHFFVFFVIGFCFVFSSEKTLQEKNIVNVRVFAWTLAIGFLNIYFFVFIGLSYPWVLFYNLCGFLYNFIWMQHYLFFFIAFFVSFLLCWRRFIGQFHNLELILISGRILMVFFCFSKPQALFELLVPFVENFVIPLQKIINLVFIPNPSRILGCNWLFLFSETLFSGFSSVQEWFFGPTPVEQNQNLPIRPIPLRLSSLPYKDILMTKLGTETVRVVNIVEPENSVEFQNAQRKAWKDSRTIDRGLINAQEQVLKLRFYRQTMPHLEYRKQVHDFLELLYTLGHSGCYFDTRFVMCDFIFPTGESKRDFCLRFDVEYTRVVNEFLSQKHLFPNLPANHPLRALLDINANLSRAYTQPFQTYVTSVQNGINPVAMDLWFRNPGLTFMRTNPVFLGWKREFDHRLEVLDVSVAMCARFAKFWFW